MIRTHTLCLPEASLVAVSALDDVVLLMATAHEVRLPPDFLDWVADEATTLVEAQLGQLFDQPEFAASLRRSDHRIALSQWVRHWVCPQIASRFEVLAGRLPQFLLASPAEQHAARLAAPAQHQPLTAGRPAFNAAPVPA